MRTVFIYALIDPKTQSERYVGKSTDPKKRHRQHICRAFSEHTHCSHWIRALLKEGFEPLLRVLIEIPEDEWPGWEQKFISDYRALGRNLVNQTEGGESGPSLPGKQNPMFGRCGEKHPLFGKQGPNHGKKALMETRLKMSLAHQGKKHSIAACEKIAAANRGKIKSKEIREKISVGVRKTLAQLA